eukprot:XP_001705356.1 Hypothetical protein GL50803_32287 [Giardia lamblia ATCC 50803]
MWMARSHSKPELLERIRERADREPENGGGIPPHAGNPPRGVTQTGEAAGLVVRLRGSSIGNTVLFWNASEIDLSRSCQIMANTRASQCDCSYNCTR